MADIKACSYCKTERDISCFAKNARASSGLCSKCKICQKKYNDEHKEQKRLNGIAYRNANTDLIKTRKREYVLANPEWKKQSNQQWADDNREKVRLLAKQRRALNPSEGAEARARWREENKERCLENSRRWRKENPGKSIEATARRRAALIQATPSWADRTKIQEFYSAANFLTKLLGERYEVDHIIPLRGRTVRGLHVETNLQILSKSENCKKNAKVDWTREAVHG